MSRATETVATNKLWARSPAARVPSFSRAKTARTIPMQLRTRTNEGPVRLQAGPRTSGYEMVTALSHLFLA